MKTNSSNRAFLVKLKKKNFNSIDLVFYTIGLKAIESGYLRSKELDLIKIFFKKILKKKLKLNFRSFPFLALTDKPSGVRMGKGKGEIKEWVSPIKKGQIIFEIKPLNNETILIDLLLKLKKKLSLKTKIINISDL